MPRGIHYSNDLKQRIVDAYKGGMSQADISTRFLVKKDIVSKTIKNFRNRGRVVNLKLGGRHR